MIEGGRIKMACVRAERDVRGSTVFYIALVGKVVYTDIS